MTLKRSGFTLIELLVVIAIIAILAAILFPVFVGVKNRAHTIQCVSNLKQLTAACIQYAQDNGGLLPWGGHPRYANITPTAPKIDNYLGSPGGKIMAYPERGQIWPYLKNKGIYKCSQDKGKMANVVTDIAGRTLAPHEKAMYPVSYAMNEFYNHRKENRHLDTVRGRNGARNKLMLLIHMDFGAMNDGIFSSSPFYQGDLPSNIHYEGTCLSYLDGHARYGSYKDIKAERELGFWNPDYVFKQ